MPLSLFRLRISHSRRRSYYLTEYIGRMAPERTKRLIADVQAWCVKHKRKQTELAPHTNTQASAP